MIASTMSAILGETDYRNSGLERLSEANALLNKGFLAGAVYLGGRDVEAMFRALIWKNDPELRAGLKSLDTGHDLRDMLLLVRNLGVFQDIELQIAVADQVQFVARLWFNNMRFVPTAKLRSIWRDRGLINKKRSLKTAVRDYYAACAMIVRKCEVLYDQA